jgi:tRNA(His) 5'-end guanylyltransferase
MKFDDLDARMRVFETAHDYRVLPGVFMVARIDGRNFTRLTKSVHQFETPFDERFRDLMLAAVRHLMGCGFRVVYGYTQSDEISLLFHRDADSFDRKLRKLDSILAAEATSAFVLGLGAPAAFDCRISQLPTENLVVDYFRWRHEDAHRNALNAHAYWTLRNDGKGAREATTALKRLSVAEKNELLFAHGVNFNDLPSWQKRGSGVWWQRYEKAGVDARTGQGVTAVRRRLHTDLDLPMRDSYAALVRERVLEAID